MKKNNNNITNKNCYFLSKGISYVDFRDTDLLQKFIDPHGRILNRKKTGLSTKYQRKVTNAIKKARFMALMPYVKQ